jgi:hypothetical protein
MQTRTYPGGAIINKDIGRLLTAFFPCFPYVIGIRHRDALAGMMRAWALSAPPQPVVFGVLGILGPSLHQKSRIAA